MKYSEYILKQAKQIIEGRLVVIDTWPDMMNTFLSYVNDLTPEEQFALSSMQGKLMLNT